jgi:hypothetical protein
MKRAARILGNEAPRQQADGPEERPADRRIEEPAALVMPALTIARWVS